MWGFARIPELLSHAPVRPPFPGKMTKFFYVHFTLAFFFILQCVRIIISVVRENTLG